LVRELDRPAFLWKMSQDHDSEGSIIRWIPIANLVHARIQLGLSSTGLWVRTTPRSVTIFEPQTPCVSLLPVLEVKLNDLRRLLGEALQRVGLSRAFVGTFPFEDVAITGLTSCSEHWSGLALKWVEQLDVSVPLEDGLAALMASGPTQRLRHSAQKLIARRRKIGTERVLLE
jgi:hypothetical protein